jgi:hypothetical protein
MAGRTYNWQPISIGRVFSQSIRAKKLDRKRVLEAYYQKRIQMLLSDGLKLAKAQQVAAALADRDLAHLEFLRTQMTAARESQPLGERQSTKWELLSDATEQAYRDRRPSGKYRTTKTDTSR